MMEISGTSAGQSGSRSCKASLKWYHAVVPTQGVIDSFTLATWRTAERSTNTEDDKMERKKIEEDII